MLITIGIYFAIAVVVLSIALKIPGLEMLIKPVFEMATKLVEFVVVSFAKWGYWMILEVVFAHRGLFDHLIHDEEYYDVRLRIERLNRQS